MNPLRSIVYVSTAVKLMSVAELDALLLEARALNEESQVTGVLLYGAGNFVQCFEGHEEAMAETYQRIRESRKHKAIIELVNEIVPARSFDGWCMGFKSARASEMLALSTARWQQQANVPAVSKPEPSGMFLLRRFWDEARQTY